MSLPTLKIPKIGRNLNLQRAQMDNTDGSCYNAVMHYDFCSSVNGVGVLLTRCDFVMQGLKQGLVFSSSEAILGSDEQITEGQQW